MRDVFFFRINMNNSMVLGQDCRLPLTGLFRVARGTRDRVAAAPQSRRTSSRRRLLV